MVLLLFLKDLMKTNVKPKAVDTPRLRQLTGKEGWSLQWMPSWATLVLWLILLLKSPSQTFWCRGEARMGSFYQGYGRPFLCL